MLKLTNYCILIFILSVLVACAKSPRQPNTVLHRADPSYTNMLERESALKTSAAFAKVVSGSSIAWKANANNVFSSQSSNVWLDIQPQTLITSSHRAVLKSLASNSFLATLKGLNITGMYLSPTHNAAAISKHSSAAEPYDDVTSFAHAKYVGNDDDYLNLLSAAKQNNILLGSSIFPTNPGIGADFTLATQNFGDYPGVWFMVEIPKTAWNLLPEVPKYIQGSLQTDLYEKELTVAQVEGLKDFIPQDLSRDIALNMTSSKGGFAATGEIKGTDGNLRRWVYRYHDDATRPVLNFDDPSSSARRILSASIIRQVDMLGSSLIGINSEPLFGLHRNQGNEFELLKGENWSNIAEPGPTAINYLSREISRYGAKTLEKDALPRKFLKPLINSGINYAYDSVLSPSSEYALLTGDVNNLRSAIDYAITEKIPLANLYRSVSQNGGVNFYLLPQIRHVSIPSEWHSKVSFNSSKLYASAPAMSAIRLNVAPNDVEKNARKIERVHTFFMQWLGGFPGMLMVSGQDLQGITHQVISQYNGASILPAWSIDSSQKTTSNGFSRGKNLYGSFDSELKKASSFVTKLKKLGELRTSYNISSAQLISRPKTVPGVIAAKIMTNSGQNIVVIANFSDNYVQQIISERNTNARDLLGRNTVTSSGSLITIELAPLSCSWILL